MATMESMPAEAGPPKRIHVLLGRRDEPTDGVTDYCQFLAEALARRNTRLEITRVPWFEHGWPHALAELQRESKDWQGEWALLQYTALAWSRRGLPLHVMRVARVLEGNGARLGVVFHDATSMYSPRLLDRARYRIQEMIMRHLYDRAAKSIVTVPPETIAWLPSKPTRAAYIPIGANIPESLEPRAYDPQSTPHTIGIFSVTGGAAADAEVRDISVAAKTVKEALGAVRLELFGRGAENAQKRLEYALEGSGVALRVRGILPAAEITRTLASCDALLCVRGYSTSRRGTAIAGVACGLPLIGYGEPGSDPAIDAAGVALSPWRDAAALAESLVRILSDRNLWQELHQRSVKAQRDFFSWTAVANRYVDALGLEGATS
jgi:glycosyltransferase involved in cell wall biosynthesis